MTHDALFLAYHEAGHIVVGRSFGCNIGDIYICLNDHDGRVLIDVERLGARQKGLLALAGPAAQGRAGYAAAYDLAWSRDVDSAFDAIDRMTGLFPGEDGFGDAYRALLNETDELVQRPDIWAAIESLVPVLAERHTLDGATAMAIIDPLLNGRRNED